MKVIEILDNFCKKIKEINPENSIVIEEFLKFSLEEKKVILDNFYQKFNLIDKGSDLLENKKTKLFSSKEEETHNFSISLFGETLPLKKVFNNLEGQERDYLWRSLRLMINLLKPDEKKVENKILGVKLDEKTNTLIEDIVKEFQSGMKPGGNPLEGIMGITEKISNKYGDQIQNGEIKLEGLVDELQNNMPGVKEIMEKIIPKEQLKPQQPKEKVIIDENFSTAKVKTGEDKDEENAMDISKMLKLVNGSEMGGMFSMIEKMQGAKSKKEQMKLKKEMDKMMKEKFNLDMDKMVKDMSKKLGKSGNKNL